MSATRPWWRLGSHTFTGHASPVRASRLQGFDGKRFDAHGKANTWMDLLIAKGSKFGVKAMASRGTQTR